MRKVDPNIEPIDPDEPFIGQPGSGKTSGSGREPFWDQMRERYENAAIAAGAVMPDPLPAPLDDAYLREARNYPPMQFLTQSEISFFAMLSTEDD